MYGKATTLVSAVPHRRSSTRNVLEEIVGSWAAFEDKYIDNEAEGSFRQHTRRKKEELYSLMKPIADLTKASQQKNMPMGLNTFLSLVMLSCTTMDTTKPLTITVPRKMLAGEETARRRPRALNARPPVCSG